MGIKAKELNSPKIAKVTGAIGNWSHSIGWDCSVAGSCISPIGSDLKAFNSSSFKTCLIYLFFLQRVWMTPDTYQSGICSNRVGNWGFRHPSFVICDWALSLHPHWKTLRERSRYSFSQLVQLPGICDKYSCRASALNLYLWTVELAYLRESLLCHMQDPCLSLTPPLEWKNLQWCFSLSLCLSTSFFFTWKTSALSSKSLMI